MRILTGYMPATEGKAIVAGFDVFDQPIEAKRRTGYLPETPPLYHDMTVQDYLSFVAKIKGVPPGERRERIRSIMVKTRIDDVASKLCARLSRSEEHTSELQSLRHLVCRLLLEKKKKEL